MLEVIFGLIIGLIAKPFQEWISYLFSWRRRQSKRTERFIEDAFILCQQLKNITDNLNHLVLAFYISKELKQPLNLRSFTYQGKANKEVINKLKYILMFELPIAETTIKTIDALQEMIKTAFKVIMRSINKSFLPDYLPEDEFVEAADGDPIKAANTLRSLINDEIDKLVQEITEFLKIEKSKIETQKLNTFSISWKKIRSAKNEKL